ncbi:MAG: transcription antitermination factor NusB [Alphaproteobacteria bacterium]|nr:transcription antitermination factor NusB [Alphaproteobacteria bacterium]
MVKFVSDKIRKKSGARLACVQATYMALFSELGIDEVIEDFLKGEIGRFAIEEDMVKGEEMVELSEMDKPYFEKLVKGIHLKKEELEEAIRGYLKDGGAYDHMNATMQALLLSAVYEICYTTDVDTKVLIQEYVDLAYAFFSKNEPKMINALLDQIAKNVRL